MKLAISEILDKTAQLPVEQQAEFLRNNDSPILRQIIEYALSPDIKWALPEGSPPFKYADDINTHGMLYSQARKLYLFIEGGNPNMNKFKREQLFIQVLESVHPADADLIVAAKDKKLPYKIDPQTFNEAFGFQFAAGPQTSPGVQVTETEPKKKSRKKKAAKEVTK